MTFEKNPPDLLECMMTEWAQNGSHPSIRDQDLQSNRGISKKQEAGLPEQSKTSCDHEFHFSFSAMIRDLARALSSTNVTLHRASNEDGPVGQTLPQA